MPNHGRRWLTTILFLLCPCLVAQVASAEPYETVINNGSPQNRIDIAVLGDGYAASDMGKYRADVQVFLQGFFAQEPFKEYQRYFNVHRIDVISNQSGADHPERNPPSFVDTAFDAAYNCSGIQRLICANFTKVNTILTNTLSPAQYDLKLLIVNDSEYGGSGGGVAIASTNSAVVELILHETGHSFGLLADEYGGPPPPSCVNNVEPPEANATMQTGRAAIKWAAWIDPGTPIPTTSTTLGVPGLYEAARYCDTGLYRPTYNSKMRSLGRPYEQINGEQLIKRIYTIASPLDGSAPAANNLSLIRGQAQQFTASVLTPFTHSLNVNWLLDGQQQAVGANFSLDSNTLSIGAHTVEVRVNDPTSAVRSDPGQLLMARRSWNVTVTPAATSTTIQLGSPLYDFNEDVGAATITVTRAGDMSGSVSADYRTVDTDTFTIGCADTTNNHGAAYARCDFATVVGTLQFAAGETSKTITVPVINDAYVEGDETFQVVLSNPTGATLNTPGTATITIKDNDTAGAPNPIFSSPFFVRQQYLDFLSREPDQSGFNAWLGVLNNCSDINNNANCDRLLVSQSFFGSQEFQLKGFYVFRFYKLAFNRLPEYAEIVPDMSFVAGSTAQEVFQRKAQLAVNFTQRQEFITNFGALANNDYVTALLNRYQLTQITTPDPANPDGTQKLTLTGADLVSRLNAGTLTRAQVLRAVTDSDQVGGAEYNNAFVAMQYYGYLRRKPEPTGYQAWLRVLQSGDIRTMVNGFMNSAEYRLRFGSATQ